ncbi:MAG: hypothetical protein U5R06_11525 [candidate division KSB1 bacterium]|nr:hypothetical protein [candidate division KSB1 bacterium]
MTTGFAGDDATSLDKINVYYFHTSYRCANCKHFDSWTQDVVENRLKSLGGMQPGHSVSSARIPGQNTFPSALRRGVAAQFKTKRHDASV